MYQQYGNQMSGYLKICVETKGLFKYLAITSGGGGGPARAQIWSQLLNSAIILGGGGGQEGAKIWSQDIWTAPKGFLDLSTCGQGFVFISFIWIWILVKILDCLHFIISLLSILPLKK